MKHRIYVDEVGNPDLESSDDLNHRFLSLTGVIVRLDEVQKVIHPQMEELKRRYFHDHPDEPVVLHRKEMLNGTPPFEALRDEATREGFDAALLSLLEAWDYTVMTVCLDKKRHKETYSTWRYDPYHYCLAVLLERFVFFLNRRGAQGDMLAESRGGHEDRRLKRSFSRLWELGTDYVPPDQFRRALTSKQLKVKVKANNIAGLQLADLVAHPSRNEILIENGHLGRPLAPFAQKVVSILQSKYDRQGVRTFGKKFI